MGIMARNAAEPLTLLEARALLHLLRLSDSASGIARTHFLWFQAHDPHVAESISGAKVEFFTSVPQDAASTLEMTLVADRVPSNGIQLGRVDDSINKIGIGLLVACDVRCSGAMTTLAADGFFEEGVVGIVRIRRTRLSRHSSGMASQTSIRNLAVESLV